MQRRVLGDSFAAVTYKAKIGPEGDIRPTNIKSPDLSFNIFSHADEQSKTQPVPHD